MLMPLKRPRRRIFWTHSNCTSLLQSIPDTIIRNGSKPEVAFPRGFPCVRVFPSWIPTVWDWPSRLQLVSKMAEVVSLCKIVSWRLGLSIDSDCPRHIYRLTMWISQKTAWAIITEVTINVHISGYLLTDFEKINCSEISQWSSSGQLVYSKMAVEYRVTIIESPLAIF